MKKIIIIGSGLSGLSCAHYLDKSKFDVKIFEKRTVPGGRVSSEKIDGYICDIGFQVLLNNYDEVKRLDVYNKLDLKYFDSGAEIFNNKGNLKVYNPIFHPIKFAKSNTFNIFTIPDIIKTLFLFINPKLKKQTVGELFKKIFSKKSRELFLNPFFKGVFLSKKLSTKADFFHKIFKKFAFGKASLPAKGMRYLPKAIIEVADLKINYNMELKDVNNNTAVFSNGDTYDFDIIILACPLHNIKDITDIDVNISYNENKTLYVSSLKKVLNKSILLIPDEHLMINSIQCLTNISKKYSTKQDNLYSISTLFADADDQVLLDEFINITKLNHNDINIVKSYTIKNSLPKTIAKLDPKNNLYFCGDWSQEASIDGALKSGRLLAESLN